MSDDLWLHLPELIREYPSEKRSDTREMAYALFDRFMRARDEDNLTRLRFALETKEDLRATFYARFESQH